MPKEPIWVEIDLNAIAHNCRQIKDLIGDQVKFMAVVKANAYGHGDVPVAKTVLKHGADKLAVARINEAIALRQAGIDDPILILSYTPPERIKELFDFDLIQSIHNIHMAEQFSFKAKKWGKTLKTHLKIDTGMGRLGLNTVSSKKSNDLDINPEAVSEALFISKLPFLNHQGVYTHFAQADNDNKTYTQKQLKRFLSFLDQINNQGLDFPLKHSANSAAVIDLPESHLDMVRPGLMIYGLYPSRKNHANKVDLKPAMTLKTRIAQIKEVSSGFKISYGSTYQTENKTKIATLPIGYADGYTRILSSRGVMLIRGQKVPVVGRVCMDLIMLDLGHLDNVVPEEEVVVFGSQNGQTIQVEEIAEACSTINYEVVSTISNRVPRYFL